MLARSLSVTPSPSLRLRGFRRWCGCSSIRSSEGCRTARAAASRQRPLLTVMVGWYHFCLMRPRLCGGRRGIPPYHLDAEIRELLNALRWARIVREHAARLWGETKRQSDLEFLEGAHLSVEPIYRLRTQAISPAQPRTQVLNAQTVQPEDRVVEPVILEVKPLANAEVRRILREG